MGGLDLVVSLAHHFNSRELSICTTSQSGKSDILEFMWYVLNQ